jgi:hypothetical protein
LYLYWHKQSQTTEKNYIPTVRILDVWGNELGAARPTDPFPSQFIPVGYVFIDNILLKQLNYGQPMWLKIEIDDLLPVTNLQPHHGILPLNTLALNEDRFYADALTPNIPAGDTAVVNLLWKTDTAMQNSPVAEIYLKNNKGEVVLKQSANLHLDGAWNPYMPQKSNLIDTLCIDTPPEMPAGEYQIKLVLSNNQQIQKVLLSKILVRSNSDQQSSSTICDLMKFRREYQKPTDENKAQVTFDSQVSLMDHSIFVKNKDNTSKLTMTIRWLSLVNNPTLRQPVLRLINDQEMVLFEASWIPVWKTHSAEYWFQGETVTDTIELTIPEIPSGRYQLLLLWQTELSKETPPFLLQEFDK